MPLRGHVPRARPSVRGGRIERSSHPQQPGHDERSRAQGRRRSCLEAAPPAVASIRGSRSTRSMARPCPDCRVTLPAPRQSARGTRRKARHPLTWECSQFGGRYLALADLGDEEATRWIVARDGVPARGHGSLPPASAYAPKPHAPQRLGAGADHGFRRSPARARMLRRARRRPLRTPRSDSSPPTPIQRTSKRCVSSCEQSTARRRHDQAGRGPSARGGVCVVTTR